MPHGRRLFWWPFSAMVLVHALYFVPNPAEQGVAGMTFNELMTAAVTNGIGMVCALAMLWFAYYRETKTIPTMMKTFTDSMERASESFERRNQTVLETFASAIREERQICQRWHEENRTRLDQIILELKDNRHLTRDMSYQLGLREALEKQRKQQKEGLKREPPGGSSLDSEK